MINAIRSDNGVEVEAILSDGLDVDTTYYNVDATYYNKRLRNNTLAKNSTLLHWAACFDATKCAKVSPSTILTQSVCWIFVSSDVSRA